MFNNSQNYRLSENMYYGQDMIDQVKQRNGLRYHVARYLIAVLLFSLKRKSFNKLMP